uniref:MIF4G domain-containing protein n=1 Tax=Rhabditophanes sp. KR3021 TaxID=114890 RepID=A0AC35U8E8_9BILA
MQGQQQQSRNPNGQKNSRGSFGHRGKGKGEPYYDHPSKFVRNEAYNNSPNNQYFVPNNPQYTAPQITNQMLGGAPPNMPYQQENVPQNPYQQDSVHVMAPYHQQSRISMPINQNYAPQYGQRNMPQLYANHHGLQQPPFIQNNSSMSFYNADQPQNVAFTGSIDNHLSNNATSNVYPLNILHVGKNVRTHNIQFQQPLKAKASRVKRILNIMDPNTNRTSRDKKILKITNPDTNNPISIEDDIQTILAEVPKGQQQQSRNPNGQKNSRGSFGHRGKGKGESYYYHPSKFVKHEAYNNSSNNQYFVPNNPQYTAPQITNQMLGGAPPNMPYQQENVPQNTHQQDSVPFMTPYQQQSKQGKLLMLRNQNYARQYGQRNMPQLYASHHGPQPTPLMPNNSKMSFYNADQLQQPPEAKAPRVKRILGITNPDTNSPISIENDIQTILAEIPKVEPVVAPHVVAPEDLENSKPSAEGKNMKKQEFMEKVKKAAIGETTSVDSTPLPSADNKEPVFSDALKAVKSDVSIKSSITESENRQEGAEVLESETAGNDKLQKRQLDNKRLGRKLSTSKFNPWVITNSTLEEDVVEKSTKETPAESKNIMQMPPGTPLNMPYRQQNVPQNPYQQDSVHVMASYQQQSRISMPINQNYARQYDQHNMPQLYASHHVLQQPQPFIPNNPNMGFCGPDQPKNVAFIGPIDNHPSNNATSNVYPLNILHVGKNVRTHNIQFQQPLKAKASRVKRILNIMDPNTNRTSRDKKILKITNPDTNNPISIEDDIQTILAEVPKVEPVVAPHVVAPEDLENSKPSAEGKNMVRFKLNKNNN